MEEQTPSESIAVTRLVKAGEPPEAPGERAVFFWNRAQASARRFIEEAWQCGKALNETKASLPHGAWHPWLQSKGIKIRTATRFMELAREFQIGQLGRFESVDAALKSVEKRKIDESTMGMRELLRLDFEQLRSRAAMPVTPSDPVNEDSRKGGKAAEIVALRQNPPGRPEDETRALKTELVKDHDHINDLEDQLALALKSGGRDEEFNRLLVTVGELKGRLRSAATSLRECREHGHLVEEENQRLSKRLRELGQHIRR